MLLSKTNKNILNFGNLRGKPKLYPQKKISILLLALFKYVSEYSECIGITKKKG